MAAFDWSAEFITTAPEYLHQVDGLIVGHLGLGGRHITVDQVGKLFQQPIPQFPARNIGELLGYGRGACTRTNVQR
jgi:hypothetical protein